MAKKETLCQCKKGERVLLVEGKNDCHVIMHLCRAHSNFSGNTTITTRIVYKKGFIRKDLPDELLVFQNNPRGRNLW